MPWRSRGVVKRLLDDLSRRLQPGFDQLMQRLDQDLARREAGERDPHLREDWVESRRALAQGRERCFGLFMDALERECADAYSHILPAPSLDPFPTRLQPLRLLDEDIVDESGALAGIAARHESAASLPLLLLRQRFAVLLERPPLAAGTLPVGPRAMGRALQAASVGIGLRLHSRLALYRIADLEFLGRFPELAAAMDELVDAAGILPGLSFVPLPARPGPAHPSGGAGAHIKKAEGDAAVAPLSATAALRVVNAFLDEVVPAGALPERRLLERREAVAALVRYLAHHEAESEAWARGREVVREVIAAARDGGELQPATAGWIRGQLAAIGYTGAALERVASGIARMGVVDGAGGTSSDETAGTAVASDAAPGGSREQRLRERLQQLAPGTMLAFTATGGITRARLCGCREDRGSVLLATDGNDQEAWVDTTALARLMAEGSAWVVRGGEGRR